MKKRNRYEIYLDILDAVRRKGSTTITRISYSAQLPVDRSKKMVDFLVSKGLLKEEDMGDRKVYRLTERGGAFLEALKTVRKFIH
ncbi:MAG: winged helix-turn-helix domain-containing protein [Candidatus Bathyarchaeia archaeon]